MSLCQFLNRMCESVPQGTSSGLSDVRSTEHRLHAALGLTVSGGHGQDKKRLKVLLL